MLVFCLPKLASKLRVFGVLTSTAPFLAVRSAYDMFVDASLKDLLRKLTSKVRQKSWPAECASAGSRE